MELCETDPNKPNPSHREPNLYPPKAWFPSHIFWNPFSPHGPNLFQSIYIYTINADGSVIFLYRYCLFLLFKVFVPIDNAMGCPTHMSSHLRVRKSAELHSGPLFQMQCHDLSAAGPVNAKCQSGYLGVSHFETLAIKRIYMCLCMDSGENPSPFAHW